MIVDDQHSLHLYLDKVLNFAALGFDTVRHASNGEEALGLCMAHMPDVMLLDIEMPRMNGIQLLTALDEKGLLARSGKTARGPGVIVLSAYDDFPYVQQCLRFGVNDYILKPVDPAELTACLTRVRDRLAAADRQLLEGAFRRACEGLAVEEDAAFAGLGVAMVTEGASCPGCPAVSLHRDGCDLLLFLPESDAAWRGQFDVMRSVPGLAAGVSGFGHRLSDLPSMMADARGALLAGFYVPGVRHTGGSFRAEIPQGCEALQTSFLCQIDHTEDSTAILRMLMSRFAQAHLAPQQAYRFCRQMLEQAGITTFPPPENFPTAASLLAAMTEAVGQLSPADGHADAALMEQVRAYIGQHFAENLTLEAVASHFYISKYQLSRQFSKLQGVTYQEYLIRVRMEAAAVLLKTSGLKLYEISARVGMDDASYFSSVFKRFYGQSPREYRAEDGGVH